VGKVAVGWKMNALSWATAFTFYRHNYLMMLDYGSAVN
jgi:hypothetical protein